MVQEVKRSDGSRHFARGDVYLSALDDSKVRFPTKLLKNASRSPPGLCLSNELGQNLTLAKHFPACKARCER